MVKLQQLTNPRYSSQEILERWKNLNFVWWKWQPSHHLILFDEDDDLPITLNFENSYQVWIGNLLGP